MPSATSAAIGWSVVFLVAGGYYFVSNQRKNKNRRTLPLKGAPKPKDSRRELRSKKARKDSESSKEKQEARPTQKARKASTEHKPSQPALHSNQSKDKNNEETADQSLKTNGIKHTGAVPRASNKSKSKKNLAQEKQRAESSDNATGNEADDELVHSPPILNAKISAPTQASKDISDMLEKPIAQPNVLKVTASTSNKLNISANRKSVKKDEFPETKKQRQNRQKVAEAKRARAEEEQERKIKLEKQRRTAREAEGRAAKDGSLFMASQAPQSSAWTAPPSLDHDIVGTSESLQSDIEDHGSGNQEVSVLSEEEQVRHVIKETETWSVVKSKEKRNRTVKGNDVESARPEIEAQESKNYNSKDAAPILPDRAPYFFVQKESKYSEENNSLEDSEWEVS